MPDRGEPGPGNPLAVTPSEEEINPFQAPLASSHVEEAGSKKRLIEILVKRLIVLALCFFSMFLLDLICNTVITERAYLDQIGLASIEGWLLALWQLLGVLLVFKRKNKTVSAILVACVALFSLPMVLVVSELRSGFGLTFSNLIPLFALALFGFLAAAISCAVLRSTFGIALQSQEDSVELRCNSIVHVILMLLMIATVCAYFIVTFSHEGYWYSFIDEHYGSFSLSTFRPQSGAYWDLLFDEQYGVRQMIEDLWPPLIACAGVAGATLPVTIILLSPKIRWLPLVLALVFGFVVAGVFVLIAPEGNTDMGIAHRSVLITSMFVCWMIFLLVCRSEYKLRVVVTRPTRISRLLLGT